MRDVPTANSTGPIPCSKSKKASLFYCFAAFFVSISALKRQTAQGKAFFKASVRRKTRQCIAMHFSLAKNFFTLAFNSCKVLCVSASGGARLYTNTHDLKAD